MTFQLNETAHFFRKNGILKSILGLPLFWFYNSLSQTQYRKWLTSSGGLLNIHSGKETVWKLEGWSLTLDIKNTLETAGEFPLPITAKGTFVRMEDDYIILYPFDEITLLNTYRTLEPPVVLSTNRLFHWTSDKMSAAQLYILDKKWIGDNCLELSLEIPQIGHIFTIKMTKSANPE